MISVLPKDLRRSFSSTAGSPWSWGPQARLSRRGFAALGDGESGSLNVIVSSISPWMRPHSSAKRRRTNSNAAKPIAATASAPSQLARAAACRA